MSCPKTRRKSAYTEIGSPSIGMHATSRPPGRRTPRRLREQVPRVGDVLEDVGEDNDVHRRVRQRDVGDPSGGLRLRPRGLPACAVATVKLEVRIVERERAEDLALARTDFEHPSSGGNARQQKSRLQPGEAAFARIDRRLCPSGASVPDSRRGRYPSASRRASCERHAFRGGSGGQSRNRRSPGVPLDAAAEVRLVVPLDLRHGEQAVDEVLSRPQSAASRCRPLVFAHVPALGPGPPRTSAKTTRRRDTRDPASGLPPRPAPRAGGAASPERAEDSPTRPRCCHSSSSIVRMQRGPRLRVSLASARGTRGRRRALRVGALQLMDQRSEMVRGPPHGKRLGSNGCAGRKALNQGAATSIPHDDGPSHP